MKKSKQNGGSIFSEMEKNKMTGLFLTDYFDHQQKEKWQQILEEQYGIDSPQKKSAKKIQLYRFASVAAIIFFVISVGTFSIENILPKNSKELVAFNLGDTDKPITNDIRKNATIKKLSETSTIAKEQLAGQIAFKEGKYDLAIDYYTEIINANSTEINDYYNLGLSYLYLGKNAQKAIEYLLITRTMIPSLKSDNKEEYKDELSWFISLAYLQNNDLENVKKELDNIILIKGYKEEEAKTLLEQISTPILKGSLALTY